MNARRRHRIDDRQVIVQGLPAKACSLFFDLRDLGIGGCGMSARPSAKPCNRASCRRPAAEFSAR
jgi:hypothetical protein